VNLYIFFFSLVVLLVSSSGRILVCGCWVMGVVRLVCVCCC
jgi:hypothetical protein